MSAGASRRRAPHGAAVAPRPSHGTASQITLQDMRFHALVGVLPHEREIPQPLEVDLTVWPNAGSGVLDYRALYEAVHACVAAPFGYLEDAGEAIARRILEDSRIGRVRVALRKPHVALPGPIAHAEVVIEHEAGAAERG